MRWVSVTIRRRIDKYRNHYLQHSSHLAEMEINMHGNPLVIHTAYMPHDASDGIQQFVAWEEMSNRIRNISHNKNVVVLGDFNAALHEEGRRRRVSRTTHMG